MRAEPQHVANILRGLGQMPNPAALDPDVAKMLGDPNLLKGQQALAGLTTNDYVFTYQVTPSRTGELIVPAFNVTADGQNSVTTPITVTVSEAKAQPWVQMRLSLSDPMPNVGAEVQLYVDLLIQPRPRCPIATTGKPYAYLPVSKTSLTLPPLERVRAVQPEQPLDQFVQHHAIEAGKRGFRVNSYPTEVKLEHEPANGPGADLDPGRYRRRLTIPLRVREGGQVTLAGGPCGQVKSGCRLKGRARASGSRSSSPASR